MTLDEILAMDNALLNLAIDEHCSQGSGASPTQHTDDWNATMALAWRYHIGMYPICETLVWHVWCLSKSGLGAIRDVTTEAAARRVICAMALWRATAEVESN